MSASIRVAAAVLLVASSAANAQAADTVALWPSKPPGIVVAGPESVIVRPPDPVRGAITRVTNIGLPTLIYYPADPATRTGVAVLVFPGGGYQYLAIDIEGTDVCHWLTHAGAACILVKYRVPQPRGDGAYRYPLQDAQRALRIVRSRAAGWHIDPRRVGVIGFSAGGDVATVLSNHFDRPAYSAVDASDRESDRPDFAMLIYPAYLVADSTRSLVPEARPTKRTPPTFLVQAEDDPVGVGNSLAYYDALHDAGVPAELHVFPAGGHGYGLRPGANAFTTVWPGLALDWMRRVSSGR